MTSYRRPESAAAAASAYATRGGTCLQRPQVWCSLGQRTRVPAKLLDTPALKRLGIRYRRPYDVRHTYATVMLMAGMNPAFCARQLGHSVEMFHRTYAKWLDGEQNDREMERLEASIAQGDRAIRTALPI